MHIFMVQQIVQTRSMKIIKQKKEEEELNVQGKESAKEPMVEGRAALTLTNFRI